MNKKVRLAIVALFFSLLSVATFCACDKDTNCYLDVKVVNGNSEIPISGAIVEIYQTACDSSDYNYTLGTTDGSGLFSTSYNAPGVMRVKASFQLDTFYYNDFAFRIGEGNVRIVEGEKKVCTIHLPTDTTWVTIAQ